MKNITIKPAQNGWIIEVGCSTFVAISKERMLDEIRRYIDSPSVVEDEYRENAVNQDDDSPDAPREQQRIRL